MSHSPGPWRWKDYKGHQVLVDVDDEEVLVGHGESVTQDVDVGEEDARLIAAAPELLRLLKAMVGNARMVGDVDEAEALVARFKP